MLCLPHQVSCNTSKRPSLNKAMREMWEDALGWGSHSQPKDSKKVLQRKVLLSGES